MVLVSFLILSLNSSILKAEANELEQQEITKVTSVEELVEYLNHVGGSEALKVINQVNSLSETDRGKLNELLADPDKLTEELNNPANYTEETTILHHDTPSLLESENVIQESANRSNISVTVKTRPKFSAFGIDFITYELVGNYTVNRNKTVIISHNSINGYVVRKWLPQVSTKVINKNMSSSTSGMFHGKVRFSYDVGVGNFGIARIGTINTGVLATPSGTTTGYINRD